MKRWLKWSMILLIGILVVIQFFRPRRNLMPPTESDMLYQLEPPEDLALIIQNSCYDCHSNQTRYPWYSHVSPVSWFLDKHIREGKEEVNFSTFGDLEVRAKIRLLNELCEEIEEGSMPLSSYLRMHRDAALTREEIEALCDWSEREALRLMRE
ncbi:MAG: heme-binding domain-containing protein [Bacteroidales bacterium]